MTELAQSCCNFAKDLSGRVTGEHFVGLQHFVGKKIVNELRWIVLFSAAPLYLPDLCPITYSKCRLINVYNNHCNNQRYLYLTNTDYLNTTITDPI